MPTKLRVTIIGTGLLAALLCLLTPSLRGQERLPSFSEKSATTSTIEPIPAGPDAFTWRKMWVKAKAWQIETMIDNYRQHGVRSDKWDADVEVYLRKYVDYRYDGSNKDLRKELGRLGDKLDQKGCTDPRITYIRGILVNQLEGDEAALPFVEKSLQQLEKSGYPREYCYYAAERLQRIYENIPRIRQKAKAMDRKKMVYLGQAAADAQFADGNQRFYIENVMKQWGSECRLPPNGLVMLEELERTPKADPWARHMVRGLYHISCAWEERGSGWGFSVGKGAWDGFGAEMQLARKHFMKAYELHPEYPEAAAWMITVAMGSGGPVSEKEWFQRAVSVHLDYMPAYRKLMWALRPRWCGSHREMYEFGVACLATGRFDTEVPDKFLSAIWDIGSELANWRDAHKSPGVFDNLQKYYKAKVAQPEEEYKRTYWRSSYAASAWAAGRYDLARQLFDELGDDLDERIFYNFMSERALVLGEVELHSGEFAAQFDQAERLYTEGLSLAALPLFGEILAKADLSEDGHRLLEDRMVVLGRKARYLKGEWVDLVQGNSLAGWVQKGGDWEIEPDGTLKCTSRKGDDRMLLLCKGRFDGDYEIRGETEAKYRAGIVFGYGAQMYTRWAAFRIDVYGKKVHLGSMFYRGDRISLPAPDIARRNKFLVRVRDGKLTAKVDENEYFTEQMINREWCDPHAGMIGLGEDYYRRDGFVLKYRNLQIRRLIENPVQSVKSTASREI